MSLKLKVVFIGDSFVGKTAVMGRLLGEFFQPTCIETTSGETIKRQNLVVNNRKVQLELWDAPGNENLRTHVAYYMNNVKVVVLFFDVTNRQSYDNIDNWLHFIPPPASSEQKPQTVIIGNKTDKIKAVKTENEEDNGTQRVVKTEEAEHKAKKTGSLYFETSAKENDTEYFKEIFMQITESVLNNLPDENNFGSVSDSYEAKQPRWYRNCTLL